MRILSLLSVLGLIMACEAPSLKSAGGGLLSGRWKLLVMEYRDSTNTWRPYLGGMEGELLYHPDGFMSLHLVPKGYPTAEMDFANFDSSQTVRHLKHLAMFYSYTGDYRVINDTIVEHKRRVHSNPAEWGSRGQRIFRVRNDSLFMRPAEKSLRHIRLKWLKSQVDP